MAIYESEGEIFGKGREQRSSQPQSWDNGEVFQHNPTLRDQLHLQATALLNEAGRSSQEQETVLRGLGAYCQTRFERGQDLASEDVAIARRNHHEYYSEPAGAPTEVKLKLCMDSRTRKTVQFGIPGGAAVSLRSPGGRDEGFTQRGFRQGLNLSPTSYFADGVEQTMRSGKHQLILIDSHLGCKKADDFETAVEGRRPADNGVIEDRRYKGMMADAIERFRRERGLGSNLTIVRYSYDPHTGFMEFFDEDQPERVVLRTDDIAARLEDVFKSVNREAAQDLPVGRLGPKRDQFKLDWMNDYRRSARDFGVSLRMLNAPALPVVREVMREAYPGLEQRDPLQFEYKCRVGLANAYSGWLLHSNGGTPHSEHKEDVVVGVMGGEHGPFREAEAFEIPRRGANFRTDAAYAAGLVRGFRQIGTNSDPVPLIMGHRVDTHDPETIALVTDLTSKVAEDLPRTDWTRMDYRDITKYLMRRFGGNGSKRTIPLEYADALAEMIEGYKQVFDPSTQDELRASVYRGNVVPVGIFVDANRAPIASLPLLPQLKAA
jgi:hypothetical protein